MSVRIEQGLGLLACLFLWACSEEIHDQHKKPEAWTYHGVGAAEQPAEGGARKPFGCDSRDLATFSCD